MKKLAFVIAASLIAAPAFAARSSTVVVTRVVSPLTKLADLSAQKSSDETSSTDTTSSKGLPSYSQSYSVDLPGLGKGGQSTSVSNTLPALGTLKVSFSNGGSGGNISYSESLSHQQ